MKRDKDRDREGERERGRSIEIKRYIDREKTIYKYR